MNLKNSYYDAVVIGAGHNGLVAATYLSKANLSVLVLEKRDKVGGAVSSKKIFKGVDIALSEYSYLLSLLPEKIIKDLGLKIKALRRTYASYTPSVTDPDKSGLLISNISQEFTKKSFKAFTGSLKEYRNYLKLVELELLLAKKVWPTLIKPMVTRAEMKKTFKSKKEKLAWDLFIEKPVGKAIEKYFKDDGLRGLIFTDAKIGILTHPTDPSYLQNRTFLYHIIGRGTGEWRVPIGGMGEIAKQLEALARKKAEVITNVSVTKVKPGKTESSVTFIENGKKHEVKSKFILSCVSPNVLEKIMKTKLHISKNDSQGTEFKINMVLAKLPKLKNPNYRTRDAFVGTFHINEGYENMKQSYKDCLKGVLSKNPPGEMYCHTLTDSSIMSKTFKKKGYNSLTLFGLDIPYSLFKKDNKKAKERVKEIYLDAINQYLEEPIEGCIAKDSNGEPCIEVKSALDIEMELGMPKGNIFHNDLSWPFVEDKKDSGTWGVETRFPNLFICGSGAKRGGCVSGIPGHNAAMKVLEVLNSSKL